MHQNANSLPFTVKPSLLALFTGRMDGISVSRFVHQLDNYFRIVELNDDIKIAWTSITLLKSTAYNCFNV